MRKLACAAAIALTCGTATAGMYHAGAESICADCHILRSETQAGAGTVGEPPSGKWPAPTQANPLLKDTKTRICLSCHDGTSYAPDVVGASARGYLRAAGYLPPTPRRGHLIGYSGKVPGGAPVEDFTCVSCHAPHGKADAYRNLNAYELYRDGSDYPKFYLGSTPFGRSADVRIDATYEPGSGSDAMDAHVPYYSSRNVFLENGDQNALDGFCGKCHGQFHNNGGSGANTNQTDPKASAFLRHPTKALISRAPGSRTYTTRVYAKEGTIGYVGCLSCHRAHGSDHPFGLYYAKAPVRGGANAIDDSESGSGDASGACTNCHDKRKK